MVIGHEERKSRIAIMMRQRRQNVCLRNAGARRSGQKSLGDGYRIDSTNLTEHAAEPGHGHDRVRGASCMLALLVAGGAEAYIKSSDGGGARKSGGGGNSAGWREHHDRQTKRDGEEAGDHGSRYPVRRRMRTARPTTVIILPLGP